MKTFATTTTTLFGVALLWTASLQAQIQRPPHDPVLTVKPEALVVQSWNEERAMIGAHSGESFSFLTGPCYARARTLLRQKFSNLEFGNGISVITPQALIGVDLFILSEERGALQTSEARALESWVNAGGALLVTANGGARLLGVTPGELTDASSLEIVTANSPLLKGPFGSITFGLSVGYHQSFATIGDATVVCDNKREPNVIQFNPTTTRRGRAVFIGDDEIFMTGQVLRERDGLLAKFPANEVLLYNTVGWLASVPGASGSFTPLGKGCAGSNGVPAIALRTGTIVKAGQPLQVALTNLPKDQTGHVMMLVGSFLDTPINLTPAGAPGCSLYVDHIAVATNVETTNGVGSWNVPIPRTPGVPFYSVHIQAAVIDPIANNLGLAFSNAARVEIFAQT